MASPVSSTDTGQMINKLFDNSIYSANGMSFSKNWSSSSWNANRNCGGGGFRITKMDSAPMKLTTQIDKPIKSELVFQSEEVLNDSELIPIKADSENGSICSNRLITIDQREDESVPPPENDIVIDPNLSSKQGFSGLAMTPFNISLTRYAVFLAQSGSLKGGSELETRSPAMNRSPLGFEFQRNKLDAEKQTEEMDSPFEEEIIELPIEKQDEEREIEKDDSEVQSQKAKKRHERKIKPYSRIFWIKRRIAYKKDESKDVVEEDYEQKESENEKDGDDNSGCKELEICEDYIDQPKKKSSIFITNHRLNMRNFWRSFDPKARTELKDYKENINEEIVELGSRPTSPISGFSSNTRRGKINFMITRFYKRASLILQKRGLITSQKKPRTTISTSTTEDPLIEEKSSSSTAVDSAAPHVASSSGSVGCALSPLPLVVV